MGRRWIGGGQCGQTALVPVDARDQLPADHLVWGVLETVAELDLSRFETAYRDDGSGRAPYDPRAVVALVLYCGMKKQTTSQEIADACRDDLGARLIMGNAYPHRGTISRFLDTHAAALQGLLAQTVGLGEAVGLVDLGVVAGDGTKVAASAAMSATVDEARLREQIADLERQVQAAEQLWATAIAAAAGHGLAEPGLFTPEDDTPDGPVVDRPGERSGGAAGRAWRRLGQLAGLLERRRVALRWLLDNPPSVALADWQERLERDTARVDACAARVETLRSRLQAEWDARVADEAAGTATGGQRRRVHPDQHVHLGRERAALARATARAQATAAARPVAARVNTTDPSSRIMPGKQGAGFDQRYNLQIMACPGPFILGVTIHDSPNDKQALEPLVHTTRATLDTAGITRRIEVALFDSGYASEDNFTADLPIDLLLIAVEQEARQTGRRHDGVTTAATAWQAMAEVLADPTNAALYKRRAAIIEPVFAQLFARFGRQLNTRGPGALTELHLWAVTHNLLKIIRRRRAKPQPVAA